MTELSYTLDVLVLRVCALAADRAAVIGLCALGRCLINCFTLFVLAEFTHLSIYLFIYLWLRKRGRKGGGACDSRMLTPRSRLGLWAEEREVEVQERAIVEREDEDADEY